MIPPFFTFGISPSPSDHGMLNCSLLKGSAWSPFSQESYIIRLKGSVRHSCASPSAWKSASEPPLSGWYLRDSLRYACARPARPASERSTSECASQPERAPS